MDLKVTSFLNWGDCEDYLEEKLGTDFLCSGDYFDFWFWFVEKLDIINNSARDIYIIELLSELSPEQDNIKNILEIIWKELKEYADGDNCFKIYFSW